MPSAFCSAKVVSKTHEQRRESWKKRMKMEKKGVILLFPVIHFLFVTAKCLSYRGSWSLSHKRHTKGHMYYYKQIANKHY